MKLSKQLEEQWYDDPPDTVNWGWLTGTDLNELRALEAKLETLKPWWKRMSNEDIAAELSATFDLGLDTTRKIADWILAAQEDDLSKLPAQQKLTEEDMERN